MITPAATGGLTIAPWQHLLAIALVAIDLLARAARIRALLPTTFRRALVINTCAEALAAVTPLRAGGEPVRYLGFHRAGIRGPAILAAFATETVIDGIILLLGGIAFAGVLLLGGRGELVGLGAALFGDDWRALAALPVIAIAGWLTARLMPRAARRVRAFLLRSWRTFRDQPKPGMATATLLTVVSLAARGAILPLFLAGVPGLSPASMLLGAVAALYVLLLSPTPAAIGFLEAGFFAGLRDHLGTGDLVLLLLTWRGYSVALGAGLGAILLLHDRVSRRRVPAT